MLLPKMRLSLVLRFLFFFSVTWWVKITCELNGARDRNRTGTSLESSQDFKSCASASSATRACLCWFWLVQSIAYHFFGQLSSGWMWSTARFDRIIFIIILKLPPGTSSTTGPAVETAGASNTYSKTIRENKSAKCKNWKPATGWYSGCCPVPWNQLEL